MADFRAPLVAFLMCAHARLGRASAFHRLPAALLRHAGELVGVLPTVDEALALPRDELRRVLARRATHLAARRDARAARRARALPLTHPELSTPDAWALLRARAARRDAAEAVADERRQWAREAQRAARRQLAAAARDPRRAAELGSSPTRGRRGRGRRGRRRGGARASRRAAPARGRERRDAEGRQARDDVDAAEAGRRPRRRGRHRHARWDFTLGGDSRATRAISSCRAREMPSRCSTASACSVGSSSMSGTSPVRRW